MPVTGEKKARSQFQIYNYRSPSMKSPVVVIQHNIEDCGAACLATIAKYHGQIFSITRTREAAGTGQLGTTLLNLKQGAKVLGFNARGVKVPLELVDNQTIPLPGIIHWKGNHWVVLYGRRGKKYIIADPVAGIRTLSREELVSGWSNSAMLLLEPRPDFYQIADDRDKVKGLWRLCGRLWNYRAILAEALLLNFAIGLLSLTSPFLIQLLTDDVLIRGDRDLLTGVAIAVLVMNVIAISIRFVQSNLIAHFAQRLELDLILEFGRVILSLPLSYYESRRSGEIATRLRDIQEINFLISQVGVTLPSQIFIAIVSLGFMLFYSWQLTIVSFSIAGCMTLSFLILLPTVRNKIRKLLVVNAENQGVLIETFKGAIALKTTNSAPYFWEEFQSRYGHLARVTLRATQLAIVNNSFSQLFYRNGGIILLWFGSTLVIGKQLSIGQLLAFNSMNGNLLTLIVTLLSFINPFTRAQLATQRIAEVIDATPESREDTQKPVAPIPADAEIICTDLNFHHPGRVDLLQEFSLSIPGGKAIALIGESGCGKSTLAKLIACLYQPQSGNIRYGIYNQQDLSLDCLRSQVVLVPQDAHFWSRTIIENFRLAAPQATLGEIVRACQIAKADEFISQLPDKYQTVLGEFGANISGGQKQRLAIARALVTNPPILILDESTGALDPVSESKVLDNVLGDRQGKTTILISHRPRVIQRADWIILLKNGQPHLQGTPGDLLLIPGDHLDFLNP